VSKPGPVHKEAVRLAQEFPTSSHRQLARMLNKEFPLNSWESCHTIIRNIRGKPNTRYIKKAEKETAPQMPKSHAEEWEKFYIEPGRTLILSDIHIKYHSEMALDSAIKWGKKYQPDTILLNGDIADFYSISRWETDPRKRNFVIEVEMIKMFLHWFSEMFESSRIVYKLGNHEERWDSFIWSKAPEIFNLQPLQIENLLELDKYGIEIVKNKRPVMIGKLPVLHGHELPKGLTSPVNAARGAYMRTKHSILVGHSHQSSSHTEPDMWHEEVVAWSTGCLCDLTPEYARINKWNHGFAAVESLADGTYDVTNLRIGTNGEIRTS
jgi:predicted phosphodiesterase